MRRVALGRYGEAGVSEGICWLLMMASCGGHVL